MRSTSSLTWHHHTGTYRLEVISAEWVGGLEEREGRVGGLEEREGQVGWEVAKTLRSRCNGTMRPQVASTMQLGRGDIALVTRTIPGQQHPIGALHRCQSLG